MADFFFDHCYQRIAEMEEYQKLARLGFKLDPKSVAHPKSLLCHFVIFHSPAQWRGEDKSRQYLEFCWVRDVAGELAYQREADGKPDLNEAELMGETGYSFRSASSLDDVFQVRGAAWQDFQPRFEHKNYDWQKGLEPRRPGWNFLTFKNAPLPGLELWVTEYESYPGEEEDRTRRAAQKNHEHSNGVHSILGFVFDLSEDEKRNLSRMLGADWSTGGVLILKDGLRIFNRREDPELSEALKDKRGVFGAVILGCESLSKFEEVSGLLKTARWAGHDLVKISSARAESWDLLVLERAPGITLT